LTSVYVKDNFKELSGRFKPRKVEIIEISDADKAQKALDAAKEKKSDFAKIAKEYGDTTTYDGSEKVYTTHSGLPDVVWNNIESTKKNNTVIDKLLQDTNAGTYYVVRVTNVKPSKFKEDAITAMKDISIDTTTTDENGSTELSLADQAFQYYLQKYDYSIHDINVYETLLSTSKKYER
ncbi:peptidyl-prolyl cis-trans isomerase, partial [Breznakia sp. OttesenSCG-928-G09]|nr:peptidyl-prolyl cis-trans isomerase [Breznakia sp. OttesenSCG-928-G09]